MPPKLVLNDAELVELKPPVSVITVLSPQKVEKLLGIVTIGAGAKTINLSANTSLQPASEVANLKPIAVSVLPIIEGVKMAVRLLIPVKVPMPGVVVVIDQPAKVELTTLPVKVIKGMLEQMSVDAAPTLTMGAGEKLMTLEND